MGDIEFWANLGMLLVAGYFATDIWRLAGVFAAAKVDENGEIFRWVRAVSTALVAALVARIIFFPIGALADVEPLVRFSAVIVGTGIFLKFGRSIAYGIIAGEIILLVGHFYLTGL